MKSAVWAVLGLVWMLAATAEANIFACCLPDATCEDLLLIQCEDRGGVSLVSSMCMDNPCNNPVMAPLISVPAIVVLTIVLLTVALFALMRRTSRK